MAICCLTMRPAFVNSCTRAFSVNLLKESGAERIGDGESASNDTLGNFHRDVCYRRSSAFIGG